MTEIPTPRQGRSSYPIDTLILDKLNELSPEDLANVISTAREYADHPDCQPHGTQGALRRMITFAYNELFGENS